MTMDADAARARWGLSRSTLQSMWTMQRSTDGRPFDRGAVGSSVRWKARRSSSTRAGGPGIETLMRPYPQRRLGIVVMGNFTDYGEQRILSAAADIVQ